MRIAKKKSMKEKFPKYTREENRACKLTDNQISEIQSRREKGEIYSSIARDYGITPQAVFYWCLSKEVRKGSVCLRRFPASWAKAASNAPEGPPKRP